MSPLLFAFAFAAWMYLLVTFGVWLGFPPFYREFDTAPDDSGKFIPLYLLVTFVTFVTWIFTQWSVLLAALGIASVLGGVHIRQDLKRSVAGPLPWLFHHFTAWLYHPPLARRPMLLSDIWTVGISLLIFLIVVLY